MVVRIHLGQPKRELWQTWCMRRTENPENVVRLHEVPLIEKIALWYNGSTTGFGSVGEGSTPSGATIALWCNGSIPDSGSGGEGSSPSEVRNCFMV